MNIKSVVCFFIILHSSFLLSATAWWIELPLQIEGDTIAEVQAKTDGMTVSEVNVNDLINAIGKYVKPEVINSIIQSKIKNISLGNLEVYGVRLNFIPENLSFSLNLDANIRKVEILDYDGDYILPDYNSSSLLTFQNSFNFINNYDVKGDIYTNGLEVNGALNLYGVYGANLIWSGNLYQDEAEVYYDRGPILLYFDRPEMPLRVSFGELDTVSNNNMSNISFTGIQISRSRSALRPTQRVTSAPNQVFDLRESADVAITINGIYLTSIRLNPGRYSLADLPISQGSNQVTLVINYLSGSSEVLEFSNFFYASPLAQGFDDFTFSSGLITHRDSGLKAEYEDIYVISAEYRYGVTDYLTVGAVGTYHPDGQIMGLEANLSGELGIFTFRPSVNSYDNYNRTITSSNYALSFSYTKDFFSSYDFSGTQLRLNADLYNNYTLEPWSVNPDYLDFNRYLIGVTQSVTSNITLSASSIYNDYRYYEDNYNAQLNLNWLWQDFRLRLGAEFYHYSDGRQEWNHYFNISWRGKVSATNLNGYTAFDSRGNVAEAELSSNGVQFAGDVDGVVRYRHYDDAQVDSIAVETHYLANRFRAGSYYQYTVDNVGQENSVIRSNITTTLAFSDGSLSLSPQPIGPIAMVTVHNSLKSDVLINPIDDVTYDESASNYLSNHISLSPHRVNVFTTSSPNAPLGYDLGDGQHQIIPGGLTGHIVEVGSDDASTLIGEIYFSNQPMGLISGIAYKGNKQQIFFTNSRGKFVIQGVGLGQYTLEVENKDGLFRGVVNVQATEDLLFYSGPVNMIKVREYNE